MMHSILNLITITKTILKNPDYLKKFYLFWTFSDRFMDPKDWDVLFFFFFHDSLSIYPVKTYERRIGIL